MCVCVARAFPANVGCTKLPAAMAGTPAGHESAPSVKAPLAFVGTPAGQEIAPSENPPLEFVPAGVPALTAEVVSTAPLKVGVELVPAGV